jgi:hypothetical protein
VTTSTTVEVSSSEMMAPVQSAASLEGVSLQLAETVL